MIQVNLLWNILLFHFIVFVISQTNDDRGVTIFTTNLNTPWGIVFLPDNTMLVTEREGKVRHIDIKGVLNPNPVVTLSKVNEFGEGGLLGITLHPDFDKNNLVYLYYTYKNNDTIFNRVIKMTYNSENKTLSDERIILDNIPGKRNHDGGRIKFGIDKYLYVTTGDAGVESNAQDKNSLAGKILRVTDDGKPATGNLFNNDVFSYGHRNPQGIAWNTEGGLYSTEHGRSGMLSGYDEINHIEIGKNYGWPHIQGDDTRQGMVSPIKHSGSNYTWAPAGADFIGDSLFFGGLKGEALYEAVIKNRKVTDFKTHFKNKYGRIREVVSHDGLLYITTSNRDGRGTPATDDDKILKLDPKHL